ncbi:hypothetical protein E2562_038542 [Oryza meyeriana var. granulata]|uniref:AB hydrolase-1 domain-containing protein n=1 Tax=Oryza meyeriana var. granulata TaxID=110450 RepID=A0A6G1F269_9ORYZ|nr:hypothetical protein E2562_038542 [Oryza meyeriana var. granulata]
MGWLLWGPQTVFLITSTGCTRATAHGRENRSMDQMIEHTYLSIRGLKLHIAHVGKGETATLLFVHGFPEVWYSWRHQMVAAAAAGFRAIAPDFPGYGLSEPPADLAQASWQGLMNDLLAIMDSLSISKEPGRAEADFGRFDTRRIMRTIYILFSKSEIPVAKQGQEIMDLADESTPMPQWFTDEDLSAYANLYEKSGFMTAIQIPYRTKAAKAVCAKPRFEMPMFVIMGQKDYILKFPALKEYMSSEKLKEIAPDYEITYIPEGSHFVQEQFPDLVNQLMIGFVNKHV